MIKHKVVMECEGLVETSNPERMGAIDPCPETEDLHNSTKRDALQMPDIDQWLARNEWTMVGGRHFCPDCSVNSRNRP